MTGSRSAQIVTWRVEPGLWWTILWGTPTVDDARMLCAAWDGAIRAGEPFASLIDAGHVTRVDPQAFAALCGYLTRRRDAIERLSTARAIVRPSGLIGAVAAGVLQVAGFEADTQIFIDAARAVAWLSPGRIELVDRYRAWADDAMRTPVALQALRELLAGTHGGIGLERAAARLGRSPRTLQRELRAAGTSFHAEVVAARIGRAKELLAGTDEKIAVVARRVGCRSEQHFIHVFRRATGATPGRWRSLVAPRG